MRKITVTVMMLAVAMVETADGKVAAGSGYPISQVPFTAVKIAPNSFWGDRIKAARNVTIPLAFSMCESEGRYVHFVKAANPGPEYDVSKFMGFSFDGIDVYKTIEGASYVLQTYPDKRLECYIDSVLDIVAAAQEPDGYLYTARTINPAKPHKWTGPPAGDAAEGGRGSRREGGVYVCRHGRCGGHSDPHNPHTLLRMVPQGARVWQCGLTADWKAWRACSRAAAAIAGGVEKHKSRALFLRDAAFVVSVCMWLAPYASMLA